MKNKNNVLMISADHWSGSLLGCEGHDTILTPTLDQLARNGIRFSNTYSECPVCIPARRTLMTGTSPRTHGDRVYTDTMEMPELPTLAETFRYAGYRTTAVGKMHVYPQRNRIGFDEVILSEEARYQFGVVDDYQVWLGERGYAGQEFLHGMGNNEYTTRPWHLPEETHQTVWATREMIRQIKRRDPTGPGFYYLSYIYPHPPLVPLQSYLDMYDPAEIPAPLGAEWNRRGYPLQRLAEKADRYSPREVIAARRAFYAQCTLIDHQIRLVIGTLREEGLLDDTIILFTSDHGDMLFDHGMVAKRVLYENSSRVPLIISGKPLAERAGTVDGRIAALQDVMPTLLDACGLEIPETVEGESLLQAPRREYLYGEISEGDLATRMIRKGDWKLIYYPVGNMVQLFNLQDDPQEEHDRSADVDCAAVREALEQLLIEELYGGDEEWARDGKLTGLPDKEFSPSPDFSFNGQRGGHWPPPV